MGAFDSHSTRYVILGVIGLVLMIIGSVFEAQTNKEALSIKYFAIVTALAIATGFLSGGIQHYLDDPVYAGYLLAIGLVVAYVTFGSKYNLPTTTRGLVTVIALGILIVLTSNTIIHEAVPHGGSTHKH
jgi:type III secretory pathway component EscS